MRGRLGLGFNEQAGGIEPHEILGWIRRLVPFSHRPFRSGQRDGLGQQLLATFGTPNVDKTFTISLGHVPSGFVVTAASVPMIVYNGTNQGSDWTPNQIVLRASAAGSARLLVI